jgi:hypothetical protein
VGIVIVLAVQVAVSGAQAAAGVVKAAVTSDEDDVRVSRLAARIADVRSKVDYERFWVWRY